MCASVTTVPAGNPETLIWMSAVADVMVPPPSLVTVRAMVAVPEPLASALVVGGTSFAGERGTVNVDGGRVPCDGAEGGDEAAPPPARMLKPKKSADIRYIAVLPPGFAQKNFRARLKPR